MKKKSYEERLKEIGEQGTTQNLLERLKTNIDEYNKYRKEWEETTQEELQEKYEIAKYISEHLNATDIGLLYYAKLLPQGLEDRFRRTAKKLYEGYEELKSYKPTKPPELQD